MGYVSSPEGNEFFGDELGVWWMVLSGHSFLAPFHFVSKPVDAIIAPESTSGGGARQKEKLAVEECLDMFDSRPKYHRIPLPRSWSAQSLPRTWSIPLHSDIGPVFKPQKSSQTNFEVQVRERMYQDVSGSCQEFLICSEQGTPAYKFLHACEFGVILRAHDDSGQSPPWFGEFSRRHFWFSCSLVKAPDASVCWPEILQYLLFDDVLFRCPTNQSWLTCVESSCFAQVTLPYLLQHLDVSFFQKSGSFQDSGATFSVSIWLESLMYCFQQDKL